MRLELGRFVVLTENDALIGFAVGAPLPAGLSLDVASGIISGTATTSGVTTITWTASDDDGASLPDSIRFTVTPTGAGHDPGLFTGTWRPPGTTNTFVVDQSELNGVSSVTSFPGCINQRSQLGSNSCGSSVQDPVAGLLTMAQGTTLAIRYLSEATIVDGSYFKLAGGDGSGVPAMVEVSLTTSPADFTGGAPCRKTIASGGMALIPIGPSGCPVTPHLRYYFNVRTTSLCNGATCRFKLLEPASMTQ